MIKEITFKKWKSFDEATLFIDPLTIIIGANASGKSNTLDVLLFLNRLASGVGISQAINGDVNLSPLRGGFEWICQKPSKQFTIIALVEFSEKKEYRFEITIQVNETRAEIFQEELVMLSYQRKNSNPQKKTLYYTKQEESNSSAIPTYFSTGTQGRDKRIDLNRSHCILSQAEALNLRKEIQEGAKFVLSKLQRIFVFDPIPSHMRNYSPFSESLHADGSNIAGVLAGLELEKKEAVEKTLTQYLKGLPEKDIKKVWTEPVGKFKTDAMLYCEEGWENNVTKEIDARGMSDGTLRYLAMVSALLICEPGSLLVIEEIDNGLHPSRAHLLMDMLKTLGKERSIDIIVTTHNPAILDAAGIRMLPFITVAHRDDQSGVSKLSLFEDIQKLPKLMASGSLGRLSSEGLIESALKQIEA